MTPRAVAAAVIAVAVLGAPAAGRAATLEVRPSKPCFGTSDRVSLVGTGFTPSRSVNIRRDGRLLNRRKGKVQPIATDADGRFAVVATVPDLVRSTQDSTYAAIDRADPARRASAPVKLSDLRVSIKPDDAAADRPRRIRARGFTVRGKTLYGHVVREKSERTFRVARLRGSCKTARGRGRLFGKNAARGTYRVQFDTFREYKSSRVQRVRFSVKIRPVTRPAAAGVATLVAQARTLTEGANAPAVP